MRFTENGWCSIRFEGEPQQYKSVGLRYLAAIVERERPEVPIGYAALDRAWGSDTDAPVPELKSGPRIPRVNMADVRATLKKMEILEDDLKELKKRTKGQRLLGEEDQEKKEDLEEKIKVGKAWLSTNTFRGKPRPERSAEENLRNKIANAINRAIEAIAEKDPDLATHLNSSVLPKSRDRYLQGPPIKWEVTRE